MSYGDKVSNDRANIVDISGTLTSSTVTVNQNQDGVQWITNKHIEYVIDEETAQVFPQEPAEKMNALFLNVGAITVIGFFADVFEIFSYIGIEIEQGIVFSVFGLLWLLVVWITKNDRWLVSLPTDGTAQFKDGLWYGKLSNGNFISYTRRAKCIYPKCDGFVHIVPAPPRERPNHTIVGKCSLGGNRHTYTVDYNGIGYPREFDWKPLEPEKQA